VEDAAAGGRGGSAVVSATERAVAMTDMVTHIGKGRGSAVVATGTTRPFRDCGRWVRGT